MATSTSQVASFYDQNPNLEHARLKENPIEYAVTWHVIQQTIETLSQNTNKPLRILDIGGGTGVYAIPLAKLGHQVVLCDISRAELAVARQYAVEEDVNLEKVVMADARVVRDNAEVYEESVYDLVLCLGPFYHLLHEDERVMLLKDLIAMTRPGGYVFAAFVTMFAHLRDVVKKDPGRLVREKDFYEEYMRTGRYTRTMPMHHTHAAEIRALFGKVGDDVAVERFVGTESFLAGRLASELQGLPEEELRPWVGLALRFAEDQELAGSADHILVVGRKL